MNSLRRLVRELRKHLAKRLCNAPLLQLLAKGEHALDFGVRSAPLGDEGDGVLGGDVRVAEPVEPACDALDLSALHEADELRPRDVEVFRAHDP